MCEPNHSISQFPDQDPDSGNPTEQRLDAAAESWGNFIKRKIGEWFHYSKMGKGHHESTNQLRGIAWEMLPPATLYEAQWWDRTVRLDDPFGFHIDADNYIGKEALAAATEYARRVSIGNLTIFRQFLETTMRRTDEPGRYIGPFHQMLTKGGSDEFQLKLNRVLGVSGRDVSDYMPAWLTVRDHLDAVIKVMMSFTRKRELLVPAWADDAKLWTPQPKSLIIA